MSDTLKHSITVDYDEERKDFVLGVWNILDNEEHISITLWLSKESMVKLEHLIKLAFAKEKRVRKSMVIPTGSTFADYVES